MKLFVIIWTLLACSLSFSQSLKNKHDLNIHELVQYVHKNNIVLLDDLIPHLPDLMKKNMLLVYDSRARNSDRVTPDTPRMIFFNKDASLIFALTRNPGESLIQSGQDTLELITFDQNTKTFQMIDVPFDGRPRPFERARVNPNHCTGCHGGAPRPIFQDYNAWPGFYGSFSQRGYAVKGSAEFGFLKKFLSQQRQMPRYKDLDLSAINEDIRGLSFKSSGYGIVYEEYKFAPALAFGVQVELRMFERLAKKLETQSQVQKYMHLISYLGRADECRGGKELHRLELKDLFAKWIAGSSQKKNQSLLIHDHIKAQVVVDFKRKETMLTRHNIPSKQLDPRGLINIPYASYGLLGTVQPELDPDFFAQQMVLIESFAQAMNLNTMDFSTTPGAPTMGVFHIRKLGLYEDEQLFKGLYEGFLANQSPLVRVTYKMNCQELKTRAIQELKLLPVANPQLKGVFYR